MYFILFVLFIAACNDPCETLFTEVKTTYIKQNSNVKIVDLKVVFPINWDEFYMFESYMNRQNIFEVIGTDCDCETVQEGERLFLFLEKGRIVSSSYGATCNKIIFSGQYNGTGFFRISDTAAVFSIIKGTDGIFLLKPFK